MYEIVTMRSKIKLPAKYLESNDRDKYLIEAINKEISGKVIDNRLLGIACIKINEIGKGEIFMGEPDAYYETTFDILAFQPNLKEVYRGQVVDINETFAMVNIGPVDGAIHISQVMDDFAEYDNGAFVGRKSKETIKTGDTVLASITAISTKTGLKIGMTMRSIGLGKLESKKKKEVEKEKKESK